MTHEKGDYSGILERIQEDLDIDELTPQDIARWLGEGSDRGMTIDRRRLATILSNIINKERSIAESFSVGIKFAKKRGIELTDKVIAKEYKKWGGKGKPAIVIRGKRGRIIAWEYI